MKDLTNCEKDLLDCLNDRLIFLLSDNPVDDDLKPEVVNDIENLVIFAINHAYEAGREEVVKNLLKTLPDCSGCTYDKNEGTHQSMSKQHFEEFYLSLTTKEDKNE